jgi:tetratricopeptide (TPR) repeat protein
VAPIFVGREEDLSRLVAGLDDAQNRRGTIFLLTGEAGIGKTRLAEELCARAESTGARVAWGRCSDSSGAPAYWPWIQVLRSIDAPPGIERPDLGQRGTEGSEDEARFALFDSVVTFLKRASESGPIVIVLDDLHWADVPSILLLKLVARDLLRSRLLIVGTYREVEARVVAKHAPILADIAREGASLPLGGLGRESVREIVRAHERSEEIAELLHETTGGNPFFIDEILRLPSGTDRAIPEGVRETIRKRIGLLSSTARRILQIGSVIGQQIDPELVAEVAGLETRTVLLEISRAIECRVIVEKSGSLRFVHDLFRETIYGDLGPLERSSLHLLAGEAIEQRSGADPDRNAAQIAHHFSAALPEGDRHRAAAWSRRAGDRAMALLAYEDAASHYRRAIDQFADSDLERTIELFLALGEARRLSGEMRASLESCKHAAELARKIGSAELLAKAALGYGAENTFGTVDPFLVALLEESLAALGDRSPSLRVVVTARLGAAMQPSPEPERALSRARQAIEEARALGDRATLARVLATARPAWRVLDSLSERLAIDQEALSLANSLGDVHLAQKAHTRLAYDHLEAGDRPAFEAHIEAFERLTEGRRRLADSLGIALAHGVKAMLDGRFDDGNRHADEAAKLEERLTVFAGAPPMLTSFLQRLALGRASADKRLLEQLLEVPTPERVAATVRPLILATLGRLEEARALYDRLIPSALEREPSYFIRVFLGEVCVRLDDRLHARRFFELLLPLADRGLVAMGVSCEGSIARLVGSLAAMCGLWEEAEAHFEKAIVFEERIGATPHLAWTKRARDEMMRDRKNKGSTSAPTRAMPSIVEDGDDFSLSWPPIALRMRGSDGLRYLAHLVEHPGVEVHVLDLLTQAGKAPAVLDASALPSLDTRAKAAYRARLQELRDAEEQAESIGDRERARVAREEIELLASELAKAVGLGGRDRKTGANAERARVNVTQRIRQAIQKIEERSPELGHHLATCVRTGVFCVYRPPPGAK